MAVAVRRSDIALWSAWVLAAGIGLLIFALMARPVLDMFDSDVFVMLRILPVVLLQYLVLRAFVGLGLGAGALWIGVSMLAQVASIDASMLWVEQVLVRLQESGFPAWANALTGGDRYIYALLIGLAQGAVLGRFSGRKLVAVVWVAANLVAVALNPLVSNFTFDLQNLGGTRSDVGMWTWAAADLAANAAITGVALVFIVRYWRRPAALAPAAVASAHPG